MPTAAVWLLASYLLGAIPTSHLVSRASAQWATHAGYSAKADRWLDLLALGKPQRRRYCFGFRPLRA